MLTRPTSRPTWYALSKLWSGSHIFRRTRTHRPRLYPHRRRRRGGFCCWASGRAAVILPLDSRLKLIRDSKTLSHAQRLGLVEEIKTRATAWSVGVASSEEIDALNIRKADALAMERCRPRAVGCLCTTSSVTRSPSPALISPSKTSSTAMRT